MSRIDRFWDMFPALKPLLEDKSVPNEYYGPTSASPNVFDDTVRLLQGAIVTRKHLPNLMSEAETDESRSQIVNDLIKMAAALTSVAKNFQQEADGIRNLVGKL